MGPNVKIISLILNAEGTEKLVCIPPILAFRLIFGMGVVSIDVFLVRLEAMPNFHSENPAAFSLIFMAKIQQCFASNASYHTKRYSHQAFNLRIRQRGCPIFMAKFRIWCTMAHRQGVCVYGAYRHACTVTSRNPSKHQAC